MQGRSKTSPGRNRWRHYIAGNRLHLNAGESFGVVKGRRRNRATGVPSATRRGKYLGALSKSAPQPWQRSKQISEMGSPAFRKCDPGRIGTTAVMIIPFWKIYSKTGQSGAMALLQIIPW